VVAWRVPRHESIVRPPSHCPACDRPLRAVDLVPVLSWALLRGRSRCCGARISIRYPLLELGCAAAFVGAAVLIT
ncbi:MAG TPA: prepilin peptidase, partial [Acidimicrobiia bacterium]